MSSTQCSTNIRLPILSSHFWWIRWIETGLSPAGSQRIFSATRTRCCWFEPECFHKSLMPFFNLRHSSLSSPGPWQQCLTSWVTSFRTVLVVGAVFFIFGTTKGTQPDLVFANERSDGWSLEMRSPQSASGHRIILRRLRGYSKRLQQLAKKCESIPFRKYCKWARRKWVLSAWNSLCYILCD